MVPSPPAPSARLLRAAAAERAELGRHRDRLLGARRTLQAELARIEESLGQIDERARLLDRLAGPPAGCQEEAGGGNAPAGEANPGEAVGVERKVLRGPAIRRAAVSVLLEH